MTEVVRHLPEEKKFVLHHKGQVSELKYRLVDSQTIDMYSTFVPQENRGLGIAQKLVKSALDYAQTENLKVIPSCWFVKKYIESNHQDLSR